MAERKQEKARPRLVWRHSSYHRRELLQSEVCGCFFCLERFLPTTIEKWTDPDDSNERLGQTAICSNCGIDSVIGSASGFEITDDLLERMNKAYFSGAEVRAKRKTKRD